MIRRIQAVAFVTSLGAVVGGTLSTARGQEVIGQLTVPNSAIGQSVAGIGDVNGDGVPDTMAGSWHAQGDPLSRVLVVSGADNSIIYEFTRPTSDDLGISVTGLGDADGDGVVDFAMGSNAYSANGQSEAYVYSGATGTWLSTVTSGPAWVLGASICSAGDSNQDGIADVAVGAPIFHVGAALGFVRVASGNDGTPIYDVTASSPNNGFGMAIASAGDLNADGYPDLVVGSSRENGDKGKVEVFSGKDAAVLFTWNGQYSGDRLGTSVGGGTDLNADGSLDIVATGTGMASGRGAVLALSGADGSTVWSAKGDHPGEDFGSDAAAGGDIDGDGRPDVVVGASLDGNNGRGSVRVYSGSDGALVSRVQGAPGSRLGLRVSGHGDVDGNGLADYAAGASGVLGLDGFAYVYAGGTCGGATSQYGAGCAGSSGSVPQLFVQGCADGAGWIEIYMDLYYPAPALIVLGTSPTSLPMPGGCSLSVSPSSILAVPAFELWDGVSAQLPSSVPSGSVYLQVFAEDKNAPHGFAATNGVSLTLP